MLEATEVACLLLRAPDAGTLRDLAANLAPAAQERGVAVLLDGPPELAIELGCDGVHLPAESPAEIKALKSARQVLGEDLILGALCGASRHSAIMAGDAGADYIGFGSLDASGPAADPELLTWWQETMSPPCVAFAARDPDQAAALATAGADFVALAASLWDQGDAAAAAQACTTRLADS